MTISSRCGLLASALLLAIAGAPAAAQDNFPSRQMRIIVPFAPGGATDMPARLAGRKMGESFGQTVIVENKPGAGGNIGAEAGAKAPADGYTPTLAAAGFMAVNPSVYTKLAYDSVKDFQPITLLVNAPLLFVVNPKVEAATVALARAARGDTALLLMDERAGRAVARERGLRVAGTAALIGMAKKRGLIASARDAFARLHDTDFRISPQVIRTVLARVGE